jgi:CDP-diacylglycerol--glycerol-3-phosphate 3-phosphatidyltransferase
MYSLLKFKKMLALHAWLAKAWAVMLTVSCIQILSGRESEPLFYSMIFLGMIAQLETVLIITILPKWNNDAPGLWHALKIRRGKEIKRYKLFNG